MNYKSATIFIIIMAISLHFTIKDLTTNKVANYLYIGQFDLKSHLLTVDSTIKDKVLFFGSSAVAGNNIPPNTTLTDYFNQQNPHYQAYNLAAHQSNLLDANILLSIYKGKKAKIAILGIDPTMFVVNQASLFSKLHSESADIDTKNLEKKAITVSLRDKIELLIQPKSKPPAAFQIWWNSSIMKIRYLFWGPLFSKKLYGKERFTLKGINSESNSSWKLIDNFIKICKANNISPIVFIEPILATTYSEDDFIVFKNIIKEKSIALNFTLFDYSQYLPSTHENFFDFIHLTSTGYEQLARKLTEDLLTSKIIKGNI